MKYPTLRNINNYSWIVEYYADGWQVAYFDTESTAVEFMKEVTR